MPELRLGGCQSQPLIGYLKALGVLRIVSQQTDRSARGKWHGRAFHLRSQLGQDELADFMLTSYAPSPVVSPWNGGSGFHPNDRKDAILTLEQTPDSRFTAYKESICVARDVLERLKIFDKPEPSIKPKLVRELRRRLPDEALPWLDAAIVVTGEKVAYPPLLGSGGNDGRYDFSNNYAQAIVNCLISDASDSAASLTAALAGGSVELQRKLSLGHLSRDSSPTNSPYGEADSLGNPWDLILAVEGLLILVAGAARRHDASLLGRALVAPFTVYATAAGYGSAVSGESGRAEVWLPIWNRWSTYREIEMLVRESRAQVGRGAARRRARTGLDFARAAGQLGVARDIDAFERYTLLERAGQSSLAVPAGRITVSERPGAAALQSINHWLDAAFSFGASDSCPDAIAQVIRRLEQASFRLAARGSNLDACETLEVMGAVEQALSRSRATVDDGIRPLQRAAAIPWIDIANDGTSEFAVAAALASLRDRTPRSPTLRDYLNGTSEHGRVYDPARHDPVTGGNAISVLASLHARRHLDAARTADKESESPAPAQDHEATDRRTLQHVGLAFDAGVSCTLRDAKALAAGKLDEDRILRLLRGLAMLDHHVRRRSLDASESQEVAIPLFDVLALAWTRQAEPKHDGDSPDDRLGARPAWAAQLAAGALTQVLGEALLRLRMAGRMPILTTRDLHPGASRNRDTGSHLGAALLLRLSSADIKFLLRRHTIASEDERHDTGSEEDNYDTEEEAT